MKSIVLVAMMALGGLLFGACAVPTEEEPEADEEAEVAASSDPTETGADVGRGILELCKALAYDNEDVRARFCLSQLDSGVAGRCWKYWLKSPVEWRNWCEYEYSY